MLDQVLDNYLNIINYYIFLLDNFPFFTAIHALDNVLSGSIPWGHSVEY